jgi:LPS-assembly protein
VELSTSTRPEHRDRRVSRLPAALVVALAAALLARAAVAATPLVPRSALVGGVEVTADEVEYDASTGKVRLRGNAIVKRGAIVLRARSADYDPETGEVHASGNVLLTDPTRVVSADAVRAILGGETEAQGVLAFVKDQPVDLSGLRSVEEAARTGHNRLTFSTPSLRADENGRMKLRDARLTLCDCPPGKPPSWEISTSEADVVPGVRATLRWPVLRIAPPLVGRLVPVFVLPWMYLPLGDRQSGVLIPQIGNTGASGFSLAVPVYFTLGRSADATVTPEYALGRKQSDVEAGKPAVRGPGARFELRWAPVERAEGRAELEWIHDLDAEPGGWSGNRYGFSILHHQQVGDATSLQAGIKLAGDPVWVRDTNGDVLAAAVPYRRSDVLASRRDGPAVSEAVASYLQPFDPVSVATGVGYGTFGVDRNFSSRLGAAAATLVPVEAGPFRLSGRLGAARFNPFAGVGPPMRDVEGRPSVTRGDARAELALPLLLGDAVTFAPWVRAAALGYAPDALASSGIAWGIAGATLETEVSRSFGSLRHAITPRLEWRAATGTIGDPIAVPAYDLYDRTAVVIPGKPSALLTASPGTFEQLRASIETRLLSAGRTVFRAELGQDFDLKAGRLAEGFAGLSFAVGRVSADASARFFTDGGREPPAPPSNPPAIPSPFLDRFTELRAGIGAEDGRGDGLRVGYLSVGPGGSGILVAGLDPLFDERAAGIPASASGTLSARARLWNARFGYDVLVPGRATILPACQAGGAERQVPALHVQQQTGTFIYESACRCFRVSVTVGVTDCGNLSYSVAFDLSRLGSSGAAFATR